MSRHNGYKTIGQKSTVAQLHPSNSQLDTDEDGMLPEWLIFHELVQTSRTFLSKVDFQHVQLMSDCYALLCILEICHSRLMFRQKALIVNATYCRMWNVHRSVQLTVSG